MLGLASDNPLAARTRIACADLSDTQFIVPQFHEEVGLINVIHQIVRIGRLPEPSTIYTKDFITAAGLAAADIGVAAVPRSLSSLKIGGLEHRPIVDLDASLELVLLNRPDLPPLIAGALCALRIDK